MDKYQKYLLDKYGDSLLNVVFVRPIQEDKRNETRYIFCDEKSNSLIIEQDEDINKTQYYLLVPSSANRYEIISNVFVYKNNEWKECEIEQKVFKTIIDFNDRVEKIKITFVNGLADELIIPLAYKEANVEKYYAKKEQEKKEDLLKKANVKVSTGADLVNIYFQPCSEDYAHTEIILYKDSMMLAKYKVAEEAFFKSISGLAYGKYEFILKQFNNKNECIVETNKINFSLSRPNFGGKPTVFI